MEYLEKKRIRQTVLQYRRLLSEQEFQKRNQMLLDQLEAFLILNPARSIHVFLPIEKNKEPDIRPLLPFFRALGVRIMTSKTDFDKKMLTHFHLNEETVLDVSKRGIPEPSDLAERSNLKDLEMILIPLLTCDKVGNRIGYGGGYYDQLLRETNAKKIGLSLSNPIDLLIQKDTWDIPIDYLITPKNTYKYG